MVILYVLPVLSPTYSNVPALVLTVVMATVSEPFNTIVPLLVNIPAPPELVLTVRFSPFKVTVDPELMVKDPIVTAVVKTG